MRSKRSFISRAQLEKEGNGSDGGKTKKRRRRGDLKIEAEARSPFKLPHILFAPGRKGKIARRLTWLPLLISPPGSLNRDQALLTAKKRRQNPGADRVQSRTKIVKQNNKKRNETNGKFDKLKQLNESGRRPMSAPERPANAVQGRKMTRETKKKGGIKGKRWLRIREKERRKRREGRPRRRIGGAQPIK